MSFIDITHTTNNTPKGPSGPSGNTPGGANGSGGNNKGGIGSIGSSGPQLTAAASGEDLVAELAINYNAKFATSTPALFRDGIVNQLMATLIAKNKANALLVGPAGSGKTKIVEYLANLIANKNARIPTTLADSVIYEIPLSNFVAGNSLVGEVEQKMKEICAFFADPTNHAILFIDEIHQLSGRNQIYAQIAQILKPYMARGEIRMIGATTTQEAENLADDPAFNRRFTRIIVDELTREQTVSVLEAAVPSYIKHYNNEIIIDDAMMGDVAAIADRFHSAGNHRPDSALTLLDRTCGEVIVGRRKMQSEIEEAPAGPAKDALIANLAAQAQRPVTLNEVRRCAMRLMTGNAKEHTLKDGELEEALRFIKGQKSALSTICATIERDAKAVFPRKRPLTILACGPSGVGKTETAYTIANTVCGTKRPIHINMCEYRDAASINRIIGAPAGYVGYASNGELPFDILDSNPYQLILLDEFEKGSPEVQRLFMGAFEDGFIKTSRGKVIDFSRSIIMMTTNAAHDFLNKSKFGFATIDTKEKSKAQMVDALGDFFDIELLNRIDVVVCYNDIDKDTYADILRDTWEREAKIAKEDGRFDFIPDEISDETLQELVEKTYVKRFGARPARRAVQDAIEKLAIAGPFAGSTDD